MPVNAGPISDAKKTFLSRFLVCKRFFGGIKASSAGLGRLKLDKEIYVDSAAFAGHKLPLVSRNLVKSLQ